MTFNNVIKLYLAFCTMIVLISINPVYVQGCYSNHQTYYSAFVCNISEPFYDISSYCDITIMHAEGVAPLILLNDGNKMPAFALGTWLGNSSTGRIEPMGTEVESAVTWALEAGYRLIDTARSYRVEDQVGKAVNDAIDEWERKQEISTPRVCDYACMIARVKSGQIHTPAPKLPAVSRDEVFITTKLWNTAHARDAVVPALNESLDALQLDRADLYLIHWPIGQFPNGSYDGTHFLDTWRGMMDARALGLARSIGVSNFNRRMLEEIREHGLATPAVLQVEWNLNLQQSELLAYCKQYDIVMMGYSPFGSLFPQKAAPGAPPPRVGNRVLRRIAKKYDKTVPQIVLRYALQLGVVPIPKSLTKTRIRENIDVFDFELDEEDKRVLRGFDCGYRTVPGLKWKDHPQYPFELPGNDTIGNNNTVKNNNKIDDNNPVRNNQTIRNDENSGGNNNHSVRNNNYPVSNNDYPESNNHYRASNDHDPVSNNQYPVGDNQYPVGNNQYPVGNNQYPDSYNHYPVSNNNYPVSHLLHLVSNNNSPIVNSNSVGNNTIKNSLRSNSNSITNETTPNNRSKRTARRKFVTPKIRLMT